MTEYKRRIKKVQSLLRAQDIEACLVLSSSPTQYQSRDSEGEYREDSDLFYLTGLKLRGLALFIAPDSKRSYLIQESLKSNSSKKQTVLWQEAPKSLEKFANELGLNYLQTTTPLKELLARLKGFDKVFYQSSIQSWSHSVAKEIFSRPSFALHSLPRELSCADIILEQLRIIKSPSEVKLIEKANKLTAQALISLQSELRAGLSESQLARALEAKFYAQGASVAFPSIVACGKSSAILHYEYGKQLLKKGQIVQFDCGARLNGYCADISRASVVGGQASEFQRELYEIVLEAKTAATKAARAGRLWSSVHASACKVLAYGLKDLGVLRKSVDKILKDKLYANYFPHSIGHSLGIDVHDSGPLRATGGAKLQAGMVVTIEPGLYFAKSTKTRYGKNSPLRNKARR